MSICLSRSLYLSNDSNRRIPNYDTRRASNANKEYHDESHTMLSYPTIPLSNSNTFKFQIVHELHIDKKEKFFHKFFFESFMFVRMNTFHRILNSWTRVSAKRAEIFLQDYTLKIHVCQHVFLLMVKLFFRIVNFSTIPLFNSNTFKFRTVHELYIDKESRNFSTSL